MYLVYRRQEEAYTALGACWGSIPQAYKACSPHVCTNQGTDKSTAPAMKETIKKRKKRKGYMCLCPLSEGSTIFSLYTID